MQGFDHRQARPMTSRLMDMMDSGEINVREVADMALGWLSEDSVKLMMQANDVSTLDDQDDDDEADDEADGQPDEAQEWHDYDHDC